MTKQTREMIACPRCSQPLRRIKGLKTPAYECRQCHSYWLDRKESDTLRSQDDSHGAEHVMSELTSKNNPDRHPSQVPLAFAISIFLRFVLSIAAVLIGFIFMSLSFTDGSSLQFRPFILLMALPLIALGVHSYMAGKALRQVSLTSVPRLNRFCYATTLYGLASSFGFVFGFGAQHDLGTKLVTALYVAVIFFFIPIAMLSLYISYSKRVKEVYLTWDAAPTSQS